MFQVNPHDFPQLAPDFNGSMPRFCRRSFDPLYVGELHACGLNIYIYIIGESHYHDIFWEYIGKTMI
jgi:hypothetical protein